MQISERDRLINEFLPYSSAVATAFMTELDLHGVVNYDDILGYAHVGLTQAADRYRPDAGAHFKTFAFARIRGAVIEGLRTSNRGRAHHRQWKASTSEAGADRTAPLPRRNWRQGCTEGDEPRVVPVDEEPSVDPFEALDARFLRDEVRRALDTLSDLDRQIIVLYYFEDLERHRIAKRLGHPGWYINRRRNAALAQLAQVLRAADADADRQVGEQQ
ncbi:MAG TPA: sigma-70 family RNA polymerase sigma factor [Polyangia bacterium]|nr:sigma-70 family RNA polymerase sigma factor [Polyangia bacterium]